MEKNVNTTQQLKRIRTDKGFIAALDQSGGSTPKALQLYGISEDQYRDEEEMFKLIHDMRTRIITSPSFSQNHIIGAILFEQTMERLISGMPTADFLWKTKKIVPFLKVDKGLRDPKDGVRLMKDIPNLSETLEKASEYGIFGTKMRSVIDEDNAIGIDKIVDQQFEFGKIILDAGLTPIIEPEITIDIPEKSKAEDSLKKSLIKSLNKLDPKKKHFTKINTSRKRRLLWRFS